MKFVTMLCGISVCALILAGCGTAPAKVVSDTIELDEFTDLDIDISSYDVTVTTGKSYSIEFRAQEGREPRISSNGEKLTIKQPSGSFFDLFSGPGVSDAYYKITIPESSDEISLTAKSSSASVTLDRIAASVKIKSSSGDVMLNDVEGKIIEIETSSGEAEADKVKAGVFSCGTSSGDIELLRIESDDISCNTASGKIELNNSVGRNVMCQASSGDVEVELNGSAEGFSIYADSSSGSIKVNGQEAKKEYVKDDGKDGKVAVHTSSGDIEINVQ